jgi:hypothetical protein
VDTYTCLFSYRENLMMAGLKFASMQISLRS